MKAFLSDSGAFWGGVDFSSFWNKQRCLTPFLDFVGQAIAANDSVGHLYAEKSEIEYRSRELRDFLFREREHLRENENIVQVDGTYYICSSTDFGDIIGHKTLDTWRAERDAEYSQPLEFDNNDYGKIYDSIVDSDYRNRLKDEYREYRTDYKDDPEELGLDDRAPYDEDKYAEWRKEGDELVEKNKDMLSWLKDSIYKRTIDRKRQRSLEDDDFGIDSNSDFEREYGHHRGEFRGGY